MKKLSSIPENRRPGRRKVLDWDQVAAMMKADPGEWYVVHEAVWPATITRIKNGGYAVFRPPSDWEVVGRGGRNKPVALIMRFVGAPGARADDHERAHP
jgi:hypothetical protein